MEEFFIDMKSANEMDHKVNKTSGLGCFNEAIICVHCVYQTDYSTEC